MGYRKKSFVTVTDQFCGAGGSSIGAQAAGAEIVLAMNHWRRAIETHNTNFPDTMHVCADISASNPRAYPSTDILITSPECTNHSLAKGVKRSQGQADWTKMGEHELMEEAAAERSRATMWDVPRFAEFHQYQMIVVENVVDARKWVMFPAWLMAMEALGYTHKALYLNSMFVHPSIENFMAAPQSRDRMYMVFWKRGNKAPDLEFRPQGWCVKCEGEVRAVQSWKNPAKPFGKYRQQYIYTCPKCAQEVMPYALPAAVAIDWSLRGERIGDRTRPLADATMDRIRAGIERYWGRHQIVPLDRLSEMKSTSPTDGPIPTQTARQDKGLLLMPFIAEMHGTSGARGVDEPLMGVTAGGNHHGLVEGPQPLYIKQYQGGSEMAHEVGDPFGTVTTQDHHSLLYPPSMIVSYYSRDDASKPTSAPLGTVTGDPRHGLLIKVAGSTYEHGTYVRARHTGQPFPTQSGTPELALLVPTRGPGAHRIDRATSADEPFPTQLAEVDKGVLFPDAFIQAYYSQGTVLRHVGEPVPTVTTQDRHALVERGESIKPEDCSFRMLEPHEIQAAMAFTREYVVTGSKREKVRQLGNAVTPPVMAEILDRCITTLG